MRKVLITGGAKRIGQAIAKHLASDGWDIAIHYSTSDAEADATVQELRKAGAKAVALKADLCDEGALQTLVPQAAEALGDLSAVINNASIFQQDDLKGDDLSVWNQHMAIHVRAPFVLTKALYNLVPDGDVGAVVNVVDQRVLNPTRHFPSYSISKMALWDQTQVLARAMAPKIRVNAIGPGPVLPSTRQSEEDFSRQASQTPLGKAVDPDEIAAAAAFLLDASSVSGQIIAVDAGQHLNWAYELPATAPNE